MASNYAYVCHDCRKVYGKIGKCSCGKVLSLECSAPDKYIGMGYTAMNSESHPASAVRTDATGVSSAPSYTNVSGNRPTVQRTSGTVNTAGNNTRYSRSTASSGSTVSSGGAGEDEQARMARIEERRRNYERRTSTAVSASEVPVSSTVSADSGNYAYTDYAAEERPSYNTSSYTGYTSGSAADSGYSSTRPVANNTRNSYIPANTAAGGRDRGTPAVRNSQRRVSERRAGMRRKNFGNSLLEFNWFGLLRIIAFLVAVFLMIALGVTVWVNRAAIVSAIVQVVLYVAVIAILIWLILSSFRRRRYY